MTPEEQSAFDEVQSALTKLTADHVIVVAEKDDLQQRFDATAQMILELQSNLKISNNARDAYANQVIVQARQIAEQKAYINKKGIVTDGPAGAT